MYNILMNSILVNEHKGILLSLILWITKYQSKLSNKLIQINLSKYQMKILIFLMEFMKVLLENKNK